MMVPLNYQLRDPRTYEDTWTWLTLNIDQLIARLPERRAGWLPTVAHFFCSEEQAKATEELFTPRLSKMAGGRRELNKALERIRICTATKNKHLGPLKKMLNP